MKGLVTAGLFLVLVAVACSGSAPVQSHNNRGSELIDAGRWQEAIAELDQAIAQEPDNATAYSNRGYAYSKLGQLERAIADYDRAIEVDPANTAAYTNRAMAYVDLGQHAQAKADCDKAIELGPPSAAAYDTRGLAFAGLGQYKLAVADYGTAIQLDPGRTSALNNRAISYSKLGQDALAIADYSKAIELEKNPANLVQIYFNRGITYANLGKRELAKADYEKALSLSSDAALTTRIQQALDRVSGSVWPAAWERGVCAAYANLAKELDMREAALKLGPPEGDDYAAAVPKFKAAAGLAAKAITQLKAVPSWPPGKPWADNLMTQAIGYEGVDNLMVGASQAASEGKLLTALTLATGALKLPAYSKALDAADALTAVLKSVYNETGFLCPTQ